MASDNFSQAVSLLYQTLEQEAYWPAALNAVADAVHAHHILFGIRDSAIDEQILLSAHVDERHVDNFVRFDGNNPMDTFLQQGPTGFAISQDSIVPFDQAMRTDFFQQVVRPMGGRHGLTAVPLRDQQIQSFFVACRTTRQGDFEKEDKTLVNEIIPHLENVLRLRKRLANADAKAWQHEKLQEQMQIGIVLLDTRLRPCWMNRRASHLLGLNDGLCISREGLHANDRETDRHLQKILHLLRNKTISHTYLKVERRSRKPPLVIRTVPLQHSEQFFAAVPHAAFGVFIDTVDEHSIEPKYLAECFNFTNREAELAKLLISGQSLSACAMEMKIGIETARSHLDNLFSKSGTRRQGELISVLLRTLWRL